MTELRFNQLMAGPYNFAVGSNLTNFFAIGEFMKKDDFYMIGLHERDGRVIINASVYASNGKLLFTLKNSQLDYNYENLFMEKTTDNSIEVVDKKGIRIFYAETNRRKVRTFAGPIETSLTELHGKFYSKSAVLVADGSKFGLVLHNVKAVMGATKTGSLGIVIGCDESECDYVRKIAMKYLS